MSHDDPTYVRSSLTNSYGLYNPYGDAPGIPPPPPKPRIKWMIAISSILIAIITVFFPVSWFIVEQNQPPRLTTLPTEYTASTIVQEFLANHLPVVSPDYSQTLNGFAEKQITTVQAKSKLSFIDPTLCNGPCGAGATWLGVYSSLTDAETAYNDIRNFNVSNTNTPYILAASQHGRCIIIGQPPTSAYVLVMNTYCT